jgi:hypothetical protein
MKNLKKFTSILFLSILLLDLSSCLVVETNGGRHRGWCKNSNNPHNPVTTNPGNGNGHGHGHGRGH